MTVATAHIVDKIYYILSGSRLFIHQRSNQQEHEFWHRSSVNIAAVGKSVHSLWSVV